jgi:uncharacterized protein YihD (DUF1040 family)
VIRRNPDRIDRILELLKEAWRNEPDFRLTQLIMVVSDKPQDAGALWHMEDDAIESNLRSYIEAYKHRKTLN